jgi:hypothetical protein
MPAISIKKINALFTETAFDRESNVYGRQPLLQGK